MTLLDELHQKHKDRLSRLNRGQQISPVEVRRHDDLEQLVANLGRENAALCADLSDMRKQLKAYSEMLSRLVTMEGGEKPRFNEIIEAVCEYYNVSRTDIMSSRRTGDLAMPRQIICYLGRNLTGMSFPQMGKRLGGRDHTTALRAANKILRQIPTDELLADDISVLNVKIGAKVMARRFGPNVEPLT